MAEQIISNNVKEAYDEFYQKHDEAWRMLGAKYKAQHIIDVSQGRTFKKVLEVGAGDGSILKFLVDADFAPEYQAVEISDSGVEHILARNIKNVKSVQVFDGYKLPFADDSFDLIILSHVLEHVEHERVLLREIKRVARHCMPISGRASPPAREVHRRAAASRAALPPRPATQPSGSVPPGWPPAWAVRSASV